jgi:hypothetical protein
MVSLIKVIPLILFVEIIILFALFGIAAAQDLKSREVQDWLAILAWGVCALAFDKYFVLVFVGTWAIAELAVYLKKPFLAWGDVLWIPVFMAMVRASMGDFVASISVLVAMLIAQIHLAYQLKILKLSEKKINGSPFVYVMFLMLIGLYASWILYPMIGGLM